MSPARCKGARGSLSSTAWCPCGFPSGSALSGGVADRRSRVCGGIGARSCGRESDGQGWWPCVTGTRGVMGTVAKRRRLPSSSPPCLVGSWSFPFLKRYWIWVFLSYKSPFSRLGSGSKQVLPRRGSDGRARLGLPLSAGRAPGLCSASPGQGGGGASSSWLHLCLPVSVYLSLSPSASVPLCSRVSRSLCPDPVCLSSSVTSLASSHFLSAVGPVLPSLCLFLVPWLCLSVCLSPPHQTLSLPRSQNRASPRVPLHHVPLHTWLHLLLPRPRGHQAFCNGASPAPPPAPAASPAWRP